ncbi:hypothetical protein GCM10025858_08030 [Alicyclobacillus sacchari]|nr:hypothetical protein GCM10025858_08030 [Alicyclobacillus sacchari]
MAKAKQVGAYAVTHWIRVSRRADWRIELGAQQNAVAQKFPLVPSYAGEFLFMSLTLIRS